MSDENRKKVFRDILPRARQIWLSKNELVFNPQKGYCIHCGEALLVVARADVEYPNDGLRCFHCEWPVNKVLCSFCKHSISQKMLNHKGIQSCLKGRENSGRVYICEDFELGQPFGEFWKKDIRNLEKAEKLLEKIVKPYCTVCKYHRKKKVCKARFVWGDEDFYITIVDEYFCEVRENFKAKSCPIAQGLPQYLQSFKLLEESFPQFFSN